MKTRSPVPVGAACLLVAIALQPAQAQSIPSDTLQLARGRYAEMSTLLEKTIFQVDAASVRVRFDTTTAKRLGQLITGRERDEALEDSLATAALAATDVWGMLEFHRGISLGQFLGGARDDMQRAVAAEIITRPEFELVSNGLPVWYSFLERRKIRRGDRMYYRIRGDSLRTVFVGVDSVVWLDQTDVGPERRRTLLGSWFASGSSFRKGLLRSLFDDR